MTTSAPEFSIIVLSYRRAESLSVVLNEIAKLGRSDIEVIVVDNASPEDIQSVVQGARGVDRFMRNTQNIGIAGWNVGLKEVRGEFIVLLDDDSYSDPEALNRARELLRQNEQVGVVAGQILHPKSGTSENAERFRRLMPGGPYDFQFIGCGAVLRRRLCEQIGGFDGQLFLYWHETEFGLRAIQAGFRIVMAPDVRFYHMQETKGRSSARRIYYEMRNMLWIFRAYFATARAAKMKLRFAAHYAKGIRSLRDLRAFLRAIRDGFAGSGLGRRSPLDGTLETFVLDRMQDAARSIPERLHAG